MFVREEMFWGGDQYELLAHARRRDLYEHTYYYEDGGKPAGLFLLDLNSKQTTNSLVSTDISVQSI